MRIIKLIACGLVGLLTLSSALRLIGIVLALGSGNVPVRNGNTSYAFGYVAGSLTFVVLGIAATMALWKSARKNGGEG